MSEMEVLRLPREFNFAWRVEISPDGKVLASGGEQEAGEVPLRSLNMNIGVRIWDPITLKELDYLEGFDTYSIKFHPNSRYLACGRSKQVYIWDIGGEGNVSLKGESKINRIAFSPDGSRLAASCVDGTIRLWDANTRESIVFQAHDPKISCAYGSGALSLAFSPDGKLLATGGCDDRICFWDPQTGKDKGFRFYLSGINPVYCIAFSPDSTLLAVNAETSTEIWDMPSRTQKCVLFKGRIGRRPIIFSQDGQVLAGVAGEAGNQEGQIWLWKTDDIVNGLLENKTVLSKDNLWPISDLAFSHDSQTLFSAHVTEIRRWRLAEHIKRDGCGGVQNTIFCGQCGAKNPAIHRFCGQCGNKLTEGMHNS